MRVLPESRDDNPLKVYFESNPGKRIDKWPHYFDVYDNHFRRFRGRPVRLLEIGVNQGGSLQMWKHYFGPTARIFGIDIDPRCKALEEEQITVLIGDQSDRTFLAEVRETIGSVDILIDDGGHEMQQQIVAFEELYRLVDADGVYLVEDLHTSYAPKWKGGLNRPTTFIARAKQLVDSLNGWHHGGAAAEANALHATSTGIHFYSSMLVIEKCATPKKPVSRRTGAVVLQGGRPRQDAIDAGTGE